MSPRPFTVVPHSTGQQRPFAKLRSSCHLAALGIAAVTFLAAACPAHRAAAQHSSSVEDNGADVRSITLTRHKSRTLKFDAPFSAAVVGAPEIADVLPMSDRVIYIQGKKTGTTNVSVFDKEKRLLSVIDINVIIDTQQINQNIHASVEGGNIRATASSDQVILNGTAKDATEAAKAVAIAQAMVPGTTVINAMKVAPSQQVLLKVRYLEVNRTAAREIGVNWYGSNKSGSQGMSTGLGYPVQTLETPAGVPLFQSAQTLASGATTEPFGVAIANVLSKGVKLDAMISALESKGLVRSLAEPDLVALSGDKASFLAGGEIPVPVIQPTTGGITVEYKRFGVELTFTPAVLSSGVINLNLKPSVSALDFTNAVTVAGYRIPAITKRETQTTIELRDGQSFAVSGLLQNEGLRDISELPWLGTVPVLGALFRSSSFQQKETELVVIVTPHLVAPAVPGQQLASPLDERIPANDVDFFLGGQVDMRKKYSEYINGGGELKGPYGHLLPGERK